MEPTIFEFRAIARLWKAVCPILLTGALISMPVFAEPAQTRNLRSETQPLPAELAEYFAPPEKYRSDFGNFRSPLLFNDGTRVQNANDWKRRRKEILSAWQTIMGPWPPLIEKPRVEVISTTNREGIIQQQLRIGIALGGEMVDALLLVPEGKATKRPAG